MGLGLDGYVYWTITTTRTFTAFRRFLFNGSALAPLISVKCLGSSFIPCQSWTVFCSHQSWTDLVQVQVTLQLTTVLRLYPTLGRDRGHLAKRFSFAAATQMTLVAMGIHVYLTGTVVMQLPQAIRYLGIASLFITVETPLLDFRVV
jgi:hypothetical protein